jgi:hypothetical protein
MRKAAMQKRAFRLLRPVAGGRGTSGPGAATEDWVPGVRV